LSSFWFIIKQQLTIEEISIFSNSSHLEWRAELSDTILKWEYPRTIPAKFGLIWFSSFREEDLNVIFYKNMPNLHNRYKSAERKISQKNPEYMLNYSFPCSCSKNLSWFRFIIKQQWTIEEISIFSKSSHLKWRAGLSDTILKGTHPRTIPAKFGLIWFRGFRGEDLNVKVYNVRQTPSELKKMAKRNKLEQGNQTFTIFQ
jgi:hypothetical protein